MKRKGYSCLCFLKLVSFFTHKSHNLYRNLKNLTSINDQRWKMIEENRWIVVSNRLPFCYDKKKKKITLSSGGLVTALSGVSSGQKKIWIGTVCDSMPKDLLMDYLKKTDDSFEYYPVVIPEKVYNLYYNHFCNEVLWPLFHYESHLVHYSQEGYEAWDRETYNLFCDYQMRLPKSYIEKTPNAITWHYSPESGLFANFLATKLCCELDEGLHHSSLEVRKIENGVQVRVKELTKPIEVPVRIETIGSLFPEVHLGR